MWETPFQSNKHLTVYDDSPKKAVFVLYKHTSKQPFSFFKDLKKSFKDLKEFLNF